MGYYYLTFAIITEIIATTVLKSSEHFTRLLPSVLVIAGYCTSIFLLSLTLKTIPVGIAYAIWCGVGIILVNIISAIIYHQHMDLSAIIGMIFITAGVIIIQLFSKTSTLS